jgi:hypothetical protein
LDIRGVAPPPLNSDPLQTMEKRLLLSERKTSLSLHFAGLAKLKLGVLDGGRLHRCKHNFLKSRIAVKQYNKGHIVPSPSASALNSSEIIAKFPLSDRVAGQQSLSAY